MIVHHNSYYKTCLALADAAFEPVNTELANIRKEVEQANGGAFYYKGVHYGNSKESAQPLKEELVPLMDKYTKIQSQMTNDAIYINSYLSTCFNCMKEFQDEGFIFHELPETVHHLLIMVGLKRGPMVTDKEVIDGYMARQAKGKQLYAMYLLQGLLV